MFRKRGNIRVCNNHLGANVNSISWNGICDAMRLALEPEAEVIITVGACAYSR